MSQGGDDRIRVECACGAHLKVPAHAVGKRAKCPKCGAAVLIEAPRPAPSPAPAGGGLLDDMALQEAAAAAAEGTAGRPTGTGGGPPICPSCAATLPPGAKLCTACGYNLSTRRKSKAASTKPSTTALAGHAAKAAGTFVLGCVLSVVAAGIGAAVWYGLAMATNREFGIVAWGIGLVTGFAMLLGSREPGILKGIIAAGIALLAIVVAKVFIFVAVISAMVTATRAMSNCSGCTWPRT